MRIIKNNDKKSCDILYRKEKKNDKKRNKPIKFGIFIIVLVAAFFLTIWVLKTFVYPLTHFSIVKEAASENSLDPYLILAIIKTESGFNENAKSNKDAKGLMQMLDSTANEVNDNINIVDSVDDNIYDADVNIKLGCKYFSNLVKRYDGNYYLAICAYNAGMGNVDKWLENGYIEKNLDEYKNVNLPFEETSKYLEKVISSYKIYVKLYS